MNPTTDFAIGDGVQSLDPRTLRRFGVIIEIADDRVRVAWLPPDGKSCTWRRTWVARKAYGKRWATVTNAAIPIETWGHDHWSVFAYIETRIVDYGGVPNREHMRVDVAVHPQFRNSACESSTDKHPTRLRSGLPNSPSHDDWSCLDDAEAAGLLVNSGTGLHRVYALTDRGRELANELRAHRSTGGSFATFVPKDLS